MKVEEVITLDNGIHYLLIEEMEYEEKKYFLGIEAKEDEIIYTNFKFFLEIQEEGEIYVEEVEDVALVRNLTLMASALQIAQTYPELGEQMLEELENQ